MSILIDSRLYDNEIGGDTLDKWPRGIYNKSVEAGFPLSPTARARSVTRENFHLDLFEVFSGGDEYSGHFVRYFFIFRRCTIKELIINEQIRAQEVRLIGDDGEQIGIIPIEEAQQRAEEAHLDLVLMSPQAKPPVAKLMDYGKFRYDSIKKLKEQKKNQKTKETKEMRLSPRIEQHDLETKAAKVKGFLDGGDACKISVRFRGRELGHKDLGREVLDQFVDLVGDSGVIDKKPTMEGRNMVMFLEPNPDKE